MARRLLAVVAASILLAGQAGAAVAGTARPASGAPIAANLIAALAQGDQRFIVEFASKADLRGAAKLAHAQRGSFVMSALEKTARTSQAAALQLLKGVKGSNPKSYWLTNSLRGPATRPSRRSSRRSAACRPSTPRRSIRSLSRSSRRWPSRRPPATPSGASRRSVRTRPGRRDYRPGSGRRFNRHRCRLHASRPHRQLPRQQPRRHVYPRLQLVGPAGPAPASRATTSATARTRWAPSPVATGPARSCLTPASRRAPSGSVPRAARRSAARARPCCRPAKFILAPTDLGGNNPDPSKAPDVVNNSWGSDDPFDSFYLDTVTAWRAAGIIPVFPAGNAGEFGCETAGTPGNFANVISVGATDLNDNIAPFPAAVPRPRRRSAPTSRRRASTSCRPCPAGATTRSRGRRWRRPT